MWLFFGCINKTLDLYKEEKDKMLKNGVLTKISLALSREPDVKKVNINVLKFPDLLIKLI